MKFAFIAVLVLTLGAFASGEFQTGGAERFRFSGSGYFRWDFYGQEDYNPENNMWSQFNINWAPRLNDRVNGRVDLEMFSNNGAIRLADAFLNLILSDNFTLRGGQFKSPFGYANTRSSSSMYFADRAYVAGMGDYRNYAVRDNGICLIAGFDPVTVDLGLFNGVGANKVADNDKNNLFAARVGVSASSWLTMGASFASIGQPEIEDTTGTTPSWSSSGINLFAHGKYPLGDNANLLFEGEYALLGRTGPDVAGMEKNDGTAMSIALAAEFGVGDGFLRTVRPAVRYDMVDPSTMLAEGADEPENNITVLDFCVGLDITSGRNTLMLGARNFSFENENVDGYTNMYLNWRMNF